MLKCLQISENKFVIHMHTTCRSEANHNSVHTARILGIEASQTAYWYGQIPNLASYTYMKINFENNFSTYRSTLFINCFKKSVFYML